MTALEWVIFAQAVAIVGQAGTAYFTRGHQKMQDKRADLHARRLDSHLDSLNKHAAMLQRLDGQVERLERQERNRGRNT